MSPRARRIALAVGGLLLLQAGAIGLYRAIERDRAGIRFAPERITGTAADIELVALDGTRSRLADRRGKVVLLHFWATWCLPCREELPVLLEVGAELAGEGGFELIAVTTDQDWDEVRAFLGGASSPAIHMDRAEGYERYGVSTLPDTFLVTAGGELAFRWSGARDWGSGEARAFLRAEVARGREARR